MNWDRIKGNWKRFGRNFKQRWCRLTQSYPIYKFDESHGISKVERDQMGTWQNHHECNDRNK